MSYASDFDKLLSRIGATPGWKVLRRRSGHVTVYSPDGKHMATASGTPSDYRAIENFKSQLKKCGWVFKRGRPPKMKLAPAPTPEPPVTSAELQRLFPAAPPTIEADIAILDRAISAVADLETLMKRYRAALNVLAGRTKREGE